MFNLFKPNNPYKGMDRSQQATNIALVEMNLSRLKREIYEQYKQYTRGKLGKMELLNSVELLEIKNLASRGFVNLKRGICIGGHIILKSHNETIYFEDERNN